MIKKPPRRFDEVVKVQGGGVLTNACTSPIGGYEPVQHNIGVYRAELQARTRKMYKNLPFIRENWRFYSIWNLPVTPINFGSKALR